MLEFVSNFIYSLIRISTPLIFVSICSTISQQAGLLNMAAEAMMLTASLAACCSAPGPRTSGWAFWAAR